MNTQMGILFNLQSTIDDKYVLLTEIDLSEESLNAKSIKQFQRAGDLLPFQEQDCIESKRPDGTVKMSLIAMNKSQLFDPVKLKEAIALFR